MSASNQSLRVTQKRLRVRHTKSRQGCYTCKSRRVKCDEAKPVCGACALRGESCGYPTATSRRERATTRQAQRRSPLSFNDGSPRALEFDLPSGSALAAPANAQSMNMVDLQLLSHFMIHTCENMSLNPARQKVWQCIIPGLAARHKFLMHLLLALSGLDYFHPDGHFIPDLPVETVSQSGQPSSTGTNDHLQVVVGHHQCGIQGFRTQLSALSHSNCHEVFAGSLLLVGFAFASLRVRIWGDSHLSAVPLPKLRLDWIYLIRGQTTVIRQCWPSLRMGPLREILQYPGATEDWKMYPSEMFAAAAPPKCSPRISRFCQGAYKALSRLKVLEESTPAPVDEDEDSPRSRPDTTSYAIKDALDVLESIYMRILYLVQFHRDGRCTSAEIEADMEDAAVMGWPQALPGEFLTTLGDADVSPSLSLVILAHFYLTLALFEATWFLKGAFDEEILKMDALFKTYGDKTFISLMEWPVSVLGV
ncbi:hypothetical protein BDV06DRAFT_188198 [Aspergillus oleicola]